jgi:hypothetical protein
VNEYQGRIESILRINNDLIKLKSISVYPDNKIEIKNVKDEMKKTVEKLLNLKKNN